MNQTHQNQFASKEPYPSLEGIGENPHDLNLIFNDYAGRISEFSAITQYVYHQLAALEEGREAVGRTLLAIAQVEMRHLNILGKLVGQLGGDPRFFYREDGCTRPWNGSIIDRCKQLERMLDRDILLEQQTIDSYRWQGTQVCQPQIAVILNRLILDEEIHIRALENLKVGR